MVAPTTTTTYTVAGTNASGTGAATSATVTVKLQPNADGTVTDLKTGLTWMRCSMGQVWNGSTCIGTVAIYTFDQANALTGTTTFANQSDWRMPNIRELQTIVDRSVYDPAIDSVAFPNTPGSDFWSGSPYASHSDYAWNVNFHNGYANYYYSNRSYSYAVRLVRGGQSFGSFVLAVSKSGTGTGTVIGSAAGINCGNTCSAALASGASVTLTAAPATGSTFIGWSGACSGTGTCTVSMTAAQNVTATFTNACTYALNANSTAAPATVNTGSISVTSSCAWTATSNASWITITAGSSGSGNGTVSYAVAANTGTTQRTGTLTIAGKTFTVTQAAGSTVAAPVCSLSANPSSITSGGSSTLTATCSPAATSYIWTGGSCAGTSAATCTVKPTATTIYSVQGSNASGTNQAASATVTVAATNIPSYTVPGTLGNDVFVLTAGNSYFGGAGNDTYIISPSTLRGGVTAKVIDNEGDNLIQLVDGMTLTASTFYSDAAQLTLSNGAIVQILGASKFKFQVGANALAGDTAAVLTYSQFVSSLGASLSGTLPASGTAGYVVPMGFTQASAPVPSVAGSSYTVPGTIGDDVLAPSGGNNYLGGGGGDTYIISPYTLSGAVTAKIIDTEGGNVIQLVGGLTIASSNFFSNAVQLTLSNGASVQILGASGFSYQLGANAPAGVTASSLTYAQFAAALGASVPTGASAVSGSANFVVN